VSSTSPHALRRGVLRAALLLTAATGAAAGAAPSVARGEAIYARCAACHALAQNRVGPKHCGLFGRTAGSVPNFEYSTAMKQARIVWNTQTLDRFLASPLKTAERADLIAYLREAGKSPECKP
jgi:cytochrome c